ncbi:putative non-LTR reverse transcriptase [Citrus sinensis]|uniref:Non-LTR reverse transcriptase n=1 Tax=Citrus sinensis TaxID=2711 RepID=A0ACB8HU77_CITSI|nr:putative non-LTR reverse transcriptase [Citrus sinensis]
MKDEATTILSIPLLKSPQSDQLIWHYDKHCNYSVKNGYQIALKLKFSETASSSDNFKTHWDVIWAKEIPEKIKVFMWRAAQNLLPTAHNLWQRKTIKEPVCWRCQKENEDIFHALMRCKHADKVWKLTNYYQHIKCLARQNMLSVLQELATNRRKEDVEMIIVLCWSIWYSRNILIFKGKREDPHLSVVRAIGILDSYRRVKTPADQTIPRDQSCLGVIIRDYGGKAVAAAVQKVSFRGDVAFMEAAAVNLGIQVAQNAKLLPIIVESDFKEVVDLTRNRKGCLSEIFWQISAIQASLKSLNQSQIQHVSRACNIIAHALAHLALNYDNLVVWVETFPAEILLLISDSF